MHPDRLPCPPNTESPVRRRELEGAGLYPSEDEAREIASLCAPADSFPPDRSDPTDRSGSISAQKRGGCVPNLCWPRLPDDATAESRCCAPALLHTRCLGG